MAEITVYPHDSERIYNKVNNPDAVPTVKKLEMINRGPAKLVRVYFQTATLTGRFETIVEQDLVINHEGEPKIMEVPQTPVARWRIVIQNDTDVNAQTSYSEITS